MTLEKTEMNNGNNGQSGAMVRQESFGGLQTATVQETASTAMAAMAKASVEARSIMGMHNPRNLDQVRTELLRECQRPSFAEVARYRKPVGQGIEGLSIRFVEQALQILGNCESSATTVYDDDQKRIVEVRVMDYERNVCHSKQITVGKHVERSKLRHGQAAIGRRTGANGQTVYIVAATDDDLLNKEAALVSKALRTCGLRLIPGWLQDESETAIKATAQNQAAKDPDAEKRKLADAFAKFNVQPKDLEEYLGHDLSKISPAELVELRPVYEAIKDGQATWQDTIEHRREQRGEEAPQQAKPSKVATGAQAVKDKLAGRKAAPVATPAPAAAPAPKAAVTTPGSGAVKNPSRSKAAQAEREHEVAELEIIHPRAAELYVAYGDPKNRAKGFGRKAEPGPAPAPTVEEMEARAEETANQQRQQAKLDAERAQVKADVEGRNTATAEDGTAFDPVTGEVAHDPNEEPEWMRGGPPPDEEF